MSKPTSKDIGNALELRVARALEAGGHGPVQRNVVLTDRHGNRSEIDVVFRGGALTGWRRGYVECKAYHGSGASVGLEEVAKFKEVLSLNGIPPSRGLFITTTGFVPRARTTGVPTLDGPGLAAWEARLARRGLLRRAGAGAAGAAAVALAALGAAAAAAEHAPGGGGGSLGGVLAQARLGWAQGASARGGGSSWWGGLWGSSSSSEGQSHAAERAAYRAAFQGGSALARAREWWAQR
jgi:hypothetical protein